MLAYVYELELGYYTRHKLLQWYLNGSNVYRSRFYEAAQASNPITLTLLGASQVTIVKLAYQLSAPLHKTRSWWAYNHGSFHN